MIKENQMDDLMQMAREAGFKASVGKTDKDGKYHPFVNALGKDVPAEWLERFAQLVAKKAVEAEREANRNIMQQALEALEVYWSKAEHRRTRDDEFNAESAITDLRARQNI